MMAHISSFMWPSGGSAAAVGVLPQIKMLSPKMQRSVRVNEHQLLMLSDRAQYDHSMVSDTGYQSAKNHEPSV